MGGYLELAKQRQQVRVGWRTNVAPAWEFDLDAIRAAARELEVAGLILVGCAEYRRGRWGGMYSFEDGAHRIRVCRRFTADEASRTLWHELTHARQQERGEREHGTQSLRGDAYDQHPREIEARANERHAARLPLVREEPAWR